jgi:hypothetical protein
MAVDYFHRLVLTGSPAAIEEMRRKLRRTVQRTAAGEHWREIIPFSFAGLYELAPESYRIMRAVPCDPYDISVWPAKRLSARRAQVRYAMHTRNLELASFIHELARKFAGITFHLVSDCDGDITSFQFGKGRYLQCTLPQSTQEDYWDRARKKFGLLGEAVYEDSAATRFAEEEMRRAALQYWDRGSRFKLCAIRSWSKRPVSRDLESEREFAMAQLSRAADVTSVGTKT